jgi:flagellar basal-body rod modification protein FlgD
MSNTTPAVSQSTADIVAATNSALHVDSSKTVNGGIGKDDFLKLLVGQLQHQDPMQPADDSQFIGQMAQFSQLEQETNNAQSTSQIATMLGHAGALSLMGRTVTYLDDNDASQTGVVKGVDVAADGSATLTVGDQGGVTVASVTEVR